MEDRLLRAAEILDSKSFEQFDKPYPEIALQMTKSLTRGGRLNMLYGQKCNEIWIHPILYHKVKMST